MLKLAQTDRPTDRPTDRAKTILAHLRFKGGHVFQQTRYIFIQLLTKFDRPTDRPTIHSYIPHFVCGGIKRPPPGGHVFFTDPNHYRTQLAVSFAYANNPVTGRKNAPLLGSHVFQANVSIFKLIQDIIETNLLTKFHEDWTVNVASRVLTRKTAPPPGGHVFSPIWTIFDLLRDINEINVLTKFHDEWAKIVTSRVFTNLHEDWASNVTSTVFTSFELNQTINVASRVFTRQNVDDARLTTDKRRSQKLTMT
ncbi:hypothetical protein DPMN_010781 [Dreissena polymorpha]|uniref:Uncharacterized protein n=1 Tax=Dreissena polymorpha TaxID=45954 RepID=A0A9D4S1B7_DREPO|nr:hypothetical protein DPMN_010781 [Dreissena polymorpha]